MLAMLSGPTLQHAQAHVELVYLGGVPLFLACWIDFVDQPGPKRLATAVATYALVAMCAAYYASLVTVPAALYAAWSLAGAVQRPERLRLRARVVWLLAFAVIAAPLMTALFANQLWAMAHGYAIDRSLYEFRKYGAPLWSYGIPTSQHALSSLLPFDVYRAADYSASIMQERSSYLGVVTLALLYVAATRRTALPRPGFWWTALGLLVLLACGALWQFGRYRLDLPAAWLKSHLVVFRQVRVPARFNLLVVIAAAVLAAGALKRGLDRMRSAAARVGVWSALTVAAVLDLGVVPFPTVRIPPTPPAYSIVLGRNPRATFLEIPQYYSGGSYLYAICGYWQTQHRGRTNAGYSGQANVLFDNLVTRNSPFLARKIEQPAYLGHGDGDPAPSFTEIVTGATLRDYAWLFLTVHGFDHVVMHQWRDENFGAFDFTRLKAQLAPARTFEDARTVVYDRARLPEPLRPVAILTTGWRPSFDGRQNRVAGQRAALALYNPDSDRPLALEFEARAFRHTRQVRLRSAETELTRWTLSVESYAVYRTPSLLLPRGLRELVLESDGEDRPAHRKEAAWETDLAPYSLRLARVTAYAECPGTLPADPVIDYRDTLRASRPGPAIVCAPIAP
jgi:hypothetical protein